MAKIKIELKKFRGKIGYLLKYPRKNSITQGKTKNSRQKLKVSAKLKMQFAEIASKKACHNVKERNVS